jgi:pimeloyl-ACP methyl ester carboxylesterase
MTVRRRVVEVHGAPASWRESGAGPTVVLVAGLGLSSSFYDGSYDAFAAAGVRLVVPDLPGWGETPGPLTGVAPEDTAHFLAGFAAALPLPPAVWVGHSLGAQAIVELALCRPALVAGLVLVGPTGEPRRFELLRQMAALAVEATRTNVHVLRGVVRDYIRTPPTRYFGTWVRHAGHDLLRRLPGVSCPVLILVGDADPMCRSDYVARLRRAAPHAQVARVRGGTHGLPRGCAPEFNEAVLSFVRAAPPPAGPVPG